MNDDVFNHAIDRYRNISQGLRAFYMPEIEPEDISIMCDYVLPWNFHPGNWQPSLYIWHPNNQN